MSKTEKPAGSEANVDKKDLELSPPPKVEKKKTVKKKPGVNKTKPSEFIEITNKIGQAVVINLNINGVMSCKTLKGRESVRYNKESVPETGPYVDALVSRKYLVVKHINEK